MADAALSDIARGGRVVVDAVPGAGKTRLLVLATAGAPSLLLAYNNQLAARLRGVVDPATTTCLTFHALCGRCLAPARDDAQLADAVHRAEDGSLVPHDVPAVERVLIDEAQDVRDVYVRLVRVLGLARPGIAMLVAGDRHQLIYDFDPACPASLRTLDTPDAVFGGVWTRVCLEASHRLPAPVAALVNAVFGTRIRAAHGGDRAVARVEVRAPRSMYAPLYDLLADALADDDALVLVDRRYGNRTLRDLLNTHSRRGGRVAVHGLDDVEAGGAAGALQCGTYWSAKGLEARTVVVLLPGAAARNPTYVALTRATERLVLVLDPRDPHPAVCAAVRAVGEDVVSVHDATTRRVLATGQARDPSVALQPRPRWTGGAARTGPRSVDRLVPRGASSTPRVDVSSPTAPPAPPPPDVPVAVALAMGLVAAEWAATGVVRAAESILQPTRLDGDRVGAAVAGGLASRVVPPYVESSSLLAPDLHDLVAAAYVSSGAAPPSIDAVAVVALGALAWDNWYHTMRQLLPVDGWARSVEPIVAWIAAALTRDALFDVPLVGHGCHARVHATTSACCYHVVWEPMTADVGAATVRAALHPQGLCVLMSVATGTTTTVRASPDVLADDDA